MEQWAFIGFNILVLLTIVYQSEWSATPPEIVVPIFSVASIVFNISTLATWRRPSTQAESKVGSLISRLHRCRATLAVPLSLTFGLLSGVTAYSLRGHGAFSGRPWLLYWTPLRRTILHSSSWSPELTKCVVMVLTTLSQEKLISSVDVTELERLKYAYKGA